MFYTREQITKLEKYRKYFETAIHSGFARNVGSVALKEIEEVYDEALGSHYSYNNGCSVCVLGFLKKVGEPFLKDSEKYKRTDELEKKLNDEMSDAKDQQERSQRERERETQGGSGGDEYGFGSDNNIQSW